MSPYVYIKIRGRGYRTSSAKNAGRRPKWDETIRISVKNFQDDAYVAIYDENMLKDSLVGKLKLKLASLCIHRLDKWFILNIDGQNAGSLRVFAHWWPLNSKIDPYTNFLFIGIDLGTTHSAAARVMQGLSNTIDGVKADIIPISAEEGRGILPSVVKTQTNGDPPFVGSSALRKQYPYPLLTFYDAKRLLGMKMSDAEIIKNLKSWSFDLIPD